MQANDINTQEKEPSTSWPVVDGSYIVGDPTAPVAVCALTSDELLKPLVMVPGVAIAGTVYTANSGIERIIVNVIANLSIRFLLLCGKESQLFGPGQSLGALVENGVDAEQRILGAYGYEPVLRNLPRQQIDVFRRQVELVDWTGEKDLNALCERIMSLAARNPGQFAEHWNAKSSREANERVQNRFTPIRPGGRREPLSYDPKGYFVISLDRAAGQIVLHHYLPDHTPAHEMCGRTAESMLLGLLREGLISQLSHAGYLGAELAKAESALRLGVGVRYIQDRPLFQEAPSQAASDTNAPRMPATVASQSWEQLRMTPMDVVADVVLEVTAQPSEHVLAGKFAEPSAEDPLRSFRRTEHLLSIRWGPNTQVVMGKPEHFSPGALLRVHGTRRRENEIDAELIAILTHVATIS